MMIKKTKKANLENKRSIFFQLGLIVALGTSLAAFEWQSKGKHIEISQKPLKGFDDIELIANTFQTEKLIAPPKPVFHNEITIVDNTYEAYLPNFNEFDWDTDREITYIAEEPTDILPFVLVQEKPTYHGGDQSYFWKDMYNKLRYPILAQEMGMEGEVIVSFTINTVGKLTNIQILRSSDPLFNNEVLRVLNESDTWKPGKQRDKAVNVSFTMPFKFKLTK